jgi:probable phosphoglycerate mutase
MLKIVLILPGATDYDQQGRIQGSLDIPLNEEGAKEVERIAQQLEPLGLEIIYCSPCEPVMQTANRLSEALDVKLKQLPNMRNLDHGLWQGMLVDEVKLRQPKVYRQWQEQPESICPPEGETIAEAMTRVQAAMSKILKKHKDGVIGLVVPEPLASLVRAHLGQGELGDLWRAAEDHGQWELIELRSPVAVQ